MSKVTALPKSVPLSRSFKRVAELLDDYADIIDCIGPCGDKEDDEKNRHDIDELQRLAITVRGLASDWEKRVAINSPEDVAEVIGGMLRDWSLAGVVWYKSTTNRFRLTREDYAPEPGEECVGVYLPNVDTKMLAEDFRVLMPKVA